MYFTILKDKIVTTKRPHDCMGCCSYLPAGARMRYIFSTESGISYGSGYYLCMRCHDYVTQHPEAWGHPTDGVDWGFVHEYRREQPLSVNGA